jgi:hypothetical protein
MTRNIKAAIAIGALIFLAGMMLIWQKYLAPHLEDMDFFPGREVPPNLVVIRPTHFPNIEPQQNHLYNYQTEAGGLSGVNLSLQQIIETAYSHEGHIITPTKIIDFNGIRAGYDYYVGSAGGPKILCISEARIVFPPNMPTNKFDYILTAPGTSEELLQKAAKDKFGYVAHWETMNTKVLALKVERPNAPGLQISSFQINTNRHASLFNIPDGTLVHCKIDILIVPLECYFNQPVLDETGLTNFYDIHRENNLFTSTDKTTINQTLKNLGLVLEPTNEPVRLLVVKKTGR